MLTWQRVVQPSAERDRSCRSASAPVARFPGSRRGDSRIARPDRPELPKRKPPAPPPQNAMSSSLPMFLFEAATKPPPCRPATPCARRDRRSPPWPWRYRESGRDRSGSARLTTTRRRRALATLAQPASRSRPLRRCIPRDKSGARIRAWCDAISSSECDRCRIVRHRSRMDCHSLFGGSGYAPKRVPLRRSGGDRRAVRSPS